MVGKRSLMVFGSGRIPQPQSERKCRLGCVAATVCENPDNDAVTQGTATDAVTRQSFALLRDWDVADRSGNLFSLPFATLICLLAIGSGVRRSVAQDLGTQQPAENAPRLTVQLDENKLTVEQLATLRQQAEAAADLTEEQKKAVLSGYDTAASELKRAQQLTTRTAESTRVAETAEREATRLRTEIDSIDVTPDEDEGLFSTLQELKTRLLTTKQQLDDARSQLSTLETKANGRDADRKKLTDAQASLPDRLEAGRKAMDAEPPADENPTVSTARRSLAIARLRALEAEGPALTAELARFEAEETFRLSTLRLELQQRQVSQLENLVQVLTSREVELRREEAARIRQLPLSPDMFERKEAERWQVLNTHLTDKLSQATDLEAKRRTDLEELQASRKRMEGREKKLGIVAPVGMEFQEQLANLPDNGFH